MLPALTLPLLLLDYGPLSVSFALLMYEVGLLITFLL